MLFGLRFTCVYVFFFKQKTAYEMRISDWSSDVCSSDLSGTRKPALAVWMGGDAQANSTLNAAGVPTYASEAEAVRGFMYLVRHREAQQALMETPPSLPQDFVVDSDAAQAVVAEALAEGRRWLEPDAVRSEEHTSELQSLMRNSSA